MVEPLRSEHDGRDAPGLEHEPVRTSVGEYAQSEGGVSRSFDPRLDEPALHPSHAEAPSTFEAHALYAAAGKSLGERWQKKHLIAEVLDKHFQKCGTAAKVAIDLERRMRVEEVVLSGMLEKPQEVLPGSVPLMEPGVEKGDP